MTLLLTVVKAASLFVNGKVRVPNKYKTQAERLIRSVASKVPALVKKYQGTTKAARLGEVPPSMAEVIRAGEAAAARLMKRLLSGELTPDDWEAAMAYELAIAYLANYQLGGGDPGDLSGVTDMLARQLPFLSAFADVISGEIKQGTENLERFLTRASMYFESSGSAFWLGKAGAWPLPAYPKDGTSQCLSHCNCHWEIDEIDSQAGDADAYWRLGASEHCQTCIERASQWSPVQIRKGVLQA